MSPTDPFSQTRARWLIGLGAATLVLTLLGAALGPSDLGERSAAPDSFSKSAVGHEALVAVLKSLEIPVERSRFRTAKRASGASLLVIAEPQLEYSADSARGDEVDEAPDTGTDTQSFGGRLVAMLAVEAPVLLILPKWAASESGETPGHVDSVNELPRSEINHVLEVSGIKGGVRSAEHADCTGALITNVALRDVQLIVDSDLHALVRCGEGILVGEVDPDAEPSQRRVVISDPDVVATHGLKHGGAQLAVTLIQDMRRNDNAVLFDEVLHGFQRIPSVYREATTFPLALLTFQILVAIAFIIWATIGRFGAPLGASDKDRGRAFLIHQEAQLLRGGRSAIDSLGSYHQLVLSKVRDALGAPRQTPADAAIWIHEAAKRRGLDTPLREIEATLTKLNALAITHPRRIKSRDVLAVTDSLNDWKRDMLNG